jgi:16S rRNA (uracil1498-N3)-methyltransferase
LPPRVAHHALRVLRLRDGDAIALFNGQGGEFAAHLAIDGKRVFAEIRGSDAVERESPLSVTLVQAWIATDTLDWVVEKSVERGVHSIVLTPAHRSVVRVTGDRLAKRLERLRELIVAACAQCGRNRIPRIEATSTLADGLQAGLSEGTVGLLLEPNADAPLSAAGLSHRRGALVVGPEGGFDEDELALARQLGYRAYRLGPRVLRTETAGLAALAALQTIAGDFG